VLAAGPREQSAEKEPGGKSDQADHHRIFRHVVLNAAADIVETPHRTITHPVHAGAAVLAGVGRPAGGPLIRILSPVRRLLVGLLRPLPHLIRRVARSFAHATGALLTHTG